MNAQIEIIRAGPFSTIQDLGRRGYLRFGVPESGAMDHYGLAIANRLVGNDEATPVIENTLIGDCFRVRRGECTVGLAGNARAKLNSRQIETWRSYRLKPDDVLDVGSATDCTYLYVALAGGLLISEVLGSSATHTRSGLGGIGRKLANGDVLEIASLAGGPSRLKKFVRPAPLNNPIRIIPGPQLECFATGALNLLTDAEWRLVLQSDRMAYRLEGPKIEHKSGYNIVSDGVLAGSIQVPGTGAPIVLMRDHQTTGGYPKIATVISADLDQFAQKRAGETVAFEVVTFDRAKQAAVERRERLLRVETELIDTKEPEDEISFEALSQANLISGVLNAFESEGST